MATLADLWEGERRRALEGPEWYLGELRERRNRTFEDVIRRAECELRLAEATRMRQFEDDLEIEREILAEQEEEEGCTTTDDDDDDDTIDEDVDDDDDMWRSPSESEHDHDDHDDHDDPAVVPPRRGAAADKLREASELLFEHKNCLPEGVYLKIFDALKCRWDGD